MIFKEHVDTNLNMKKNDFKMIVIEKILHFETCQVSKNCNTMMGISKLRSLYLLG